MSASRILCRWLSSGTTTTTTSKLYDQHIPLTSLQKLILSIGSGVGALIDPYRHDLVADFGETTGHSALKWIRNQMLADDEGKRVLNEKPRLRSDRIDYERLRSLPENTFGYHYSKFYTDNKVSPDTRKQVHFVDDAELAYVMQRYRELHDIFHTILNQPTTIKGEIVVKAFEAVQTRLPLCILGGVLGPLKMDNLGRFEYLSKDLPWALECGRKSKFFMNVFFEERFEQDIASLRSELNVTLIESA